MNKLRINRKGIYEIEVNDKGETIAFDLEDIELPFKLQEALDGINKIQDELKAELVIIGKRSDAERKGSLLTKNQFDTAKAWRKAFRSMRVEMDKFLGEGGCKKIFGDANYLEMYDDLFEELSRPDENGQSHLDRMKLSSESVRERITKKYEKYAENSAVI